jgi:hypothetical protein
MPVSMALAQLLQDNPVTGMMELLICFIVFGVFLQCQDINPVLSSDADAM